MRAYECLFHQGQANPCFYECDGIYSLSLIADGYKTMRMRYQVPPEKKKVVSQCINRNTAHSTTVHQKIKTKISIKQVVAWRRANKYNVNGCICLENVVCRKINPSGSAHLTHPHFGKQTKNVLKWVQPKHCETVNAGLQNDQNENFLFYAIALDNCCLLGKSYANLYLFLLLIYTHKQHRKIELIKNTMPTSICRIGFLRLDHALYVVESPLFVKKIF